MRPIPRYISAFLAFCAVLAVVCGVLFVLLPFSPESRTASGVETPAAPVIVIDAGHGGEDGGASGSDGTTEKELNLLLSEALAELLAIAGYDVRMTRTDDRLLYDRYGDLTDYTGYKKVYDLRNRLRFAREADAALLISIHMNKFPDGRYSGLQVYHGSAEQSRTVAEAIQRTVRNSLQPENNRAIKPGGSSIYLLNRMESPAVMIECGFLSHEEELSRLKDPAYRRDLALCIAAAVASALQ